MLGLVQSQARCIILTSSLLEPFKTALPEMGISSPISLVNQHIINSDQIRVNILCSGPDGELFESSDINQ